MARVIRKASLSKFREVYEGERIGGGLKFRPAPYLPIIGFDDEVKIGIVLKAGTIVSIDEYGYIVPANCGTEQALTYGALDVQEGVFDLDSFNNSKTDTLVSTAKTTTAKIPANKPIGVLMHDVYQWDLGKDPHYTFLNQIPTVLCDWMVQYALDETYAALDWEPGKLVVPDSTGYPVPLDASAIDVSGGTLDLNKYLDQVIGKVVRVVDVNSALDRNWLGGYDKVKVVPGLDLPEGITDGLDPDTMKAVLIQLNI